MPLARMATWFLVSAVAAKPMTNAPFHSDALSLVLPYLAPLAVFGFLVVLYRVAAGLTQPSRLGDAALAASVLTLVSLALMLRWPVLSNLFSGLGHNALSWLIGTHWRVAHVLAPLAWLAFLLTFIRWPAPPLARASCRAAGWLALVLCLAGLWPVLSSVETLVFFCVGFQYGGSQAYYSWMNLLSGILEALRWILLSVFALAVWRIRPPAAPGGTPGINGV